MKSLHALFGAIAILCPSILWAANTAPVVNAGSDDTIRLGYSFRFSPEITTGSGSLDYTVLWTQVAGPVGGSSFGLASAEATQVIFTKTGAYTFRLTVTDLGLSSSDEVIITVQDSIAFLVLEPRADDTVRIGDTVTVRWQIDPPVAVQVRLSTNAGLTSEYIQDAQTFGTSFQWIVSDTLKPSSTCVLELNEYFDHTKKTSSGMFVLADKKVVQPPEEPGSSKSGCGAGVGLALVPPIGFRLRSASKKLGNPRRS